jgi:hypothetical protein
MTSILHNVTDIIDQALGLRTIGNRIYTSANKSACIRLCSRSEQNRQIDGSSLVRSILEQIAANRRELNDKCLPCTGGRNWRFETMYDFDLETKYEMQLQKAIAILLDGEWANAVPTASGLTECRETARDIDLVQRLSGEEWRFVELKAMRRGGGGCRGDQTPLFAALELLQYALIFHFSKQHAALLGYRADKNPVIAAEKVHLEVLMTTNCYFYRSRIQRSRNSTTDRFNIEWVHDLISEGLRALNEQQPHLVQFDFCFSEFSEDFEWTEDDHRQLHLIVAEHEFQRCRDELEKSEVGLRLQTKIRAALKDRVPAVLS